LFPKLFNLFLANILEQNKNPVFNVELLE